MAITGSDRVTDALAQPVGAKKASTSLSLAAARLAALFLLRG